MSKEVAEKKSTQVASMGITSMFKEHSGEGNESVSQEDLALPFLKILQGIDSILDELPDARKGDLYNTVTGKLYKGDKGVTVVPCAYQRRFIHWAPRGTGTGAPIAVYSPKDEMPKTQKGSEDNRDYVVEGEGSYLDQTAQQFVMIVNDDGTCEPALIAMKSSQLKVSKNWNSKIAGVQLKDEDGEIFAAPRFSLLFKVTSKKQDNSKGSWHGWNVEYVKPMEDADLFAKCHAFHQSIIAGEVNVKHTDDTEIPF